MKLSWDKPPPILLVGGKEHLLIKRFCDKISKSASEAGLEVHYADSPEDVLEALQSDTTLWGSRGPIPFVIHRSVRSDTPLPSDIHTKIPKHKACLLFVVDGAINSRSCPVLDVVPQTHQMTFDPPPSGLGINKKSLDYAVEFLVEEFGSHRDMISTPPRSLLESMVKTVGADLGTLAFEVDKAVSLAVAEGRDTIDPSHIKRVIRPSNHFDMTPIRESLAKRKTKSLLESLGRAYKYSVSDPTMMLLRGKGGPGDLAITWLQSSLCLDKGGSADKISDLTGTPVWAVVRDTIPAVRLWGTDNLRHLVRSLAEVDRGYLLGAPSPRTALESALVRSVSR